MDKHLCDLTEKSNTGHDNLVHFTWNDTYGQNNYYCRNRYHAIIKSLLRKDVLKLRSILYNKKFAMSLQNMPSRDVYKNVTYCISFSSGDKCVAKNSIVSYYTHCSSTKWKKKILTLLSLALWIRDTRSMKILLKCPKIIVTHREIILALHLKDMEMFDLLYARYKEQRNFIGNNDISKSFIAKIVSSNAFEKDIYQYFEMLRHLNHSFEFTYHHNMIPFKQDRSAWGHLFMNCHEERGARLMSRLLTQQDVNSRDSCYNIPLAYIFSEKYTINVNRLRHLTRRGANYRLQMKVISSEKERSLIRYIIEMFEFYSTDMSTEQEVRPVFKCPSPLK